MGRQIELIMVTTENNNKYYRMIENDNNTWTAIWGRVGATESQKIYPMSLWDRKYKEKTEKGYQDVTSLRSTTAKSGVQAGELITMLLGFSKQAIVDNYIVSSSEVTQAQVDKAQTILNEVSLIIGDPTILWLQKADVVNGMLKQLYTTIPRRMKHTKYHFINQDDSITKMTDLIQVEQDSLDNMAQSVNMNVQEDTSGASTVEESLGITVEPADEAAVAYIKKLLGEEVGRFTRAYHVSNIRTEREFKDQLPKSYSRATRMLWHGSRNENWLSIISRGLLIRPTGAVFTGSMFGNGCYFANRARKSIGYTSITGSYWASGKSNKAFLALYEVNTGKEYITQTSGGWVGNCDERTIRANGCDSVYAQAGLSLRNDEHIVYNQNQSTVRYVIELG